MLNSAATRCAFSSRPLHTARSSAPSHTLKAGACALRAKPVPIKPTPIFSSFISKIHLNVSLIELPGLEETVWRSIVASRFQNTEVQTNVHLVHFSPSHVTFPLGTAVLYNRAVFLPSSKPLVKNRVSISTAKA